MNRTIAFALVLSGLVLISAAPPPDADEWERRGNAAFADARFDEAARCYAAAEERTGEPGRVAFNHGVALFQLGRYRDAERLFRCAVEGDGPAERRTRALFNLGTSLLHASDGRDAARLAEAADCFNRLLRIPDLDPTLAADARHNLELAKLLWRRIRTSEPPPPESDPTAPNRDDESPTKPPEGGTSDASTDRTGAGRPGDRTAPAPTVGEGPKPVATPDTPPPGAGRHAQIPEEDQMKPLPPQEARELLRQAAERIQRDRRALQKAGAGGEVRPYPDW